MTSSIKTCERKIIEGSLAHDGGALMAWAISNLRIEPRGNAILATKAAAGAGKIDPCMALFDAASLMAMNPANTRSIYDSMSESTFKELAGTSGGGGDDDDDDGGYGRRIW